MLLGETPYGDLAYGDSSSSLLSVSQWKDRLLNEPWLGISWLVRARPRDASTSTVPPTLIDVDLSSDGHANRPTDPDHIQFPGKLIQPFSLTFGLGKKLWGHAGSDSGEIRIGDADTTLRSLAGEDWIGREADVYYGPRGGAQGDFTLFARLLTRSLRYDRRVMSLIADDHGFIFERELQTNLYAGTGGLEGGTEIKGSPKPILIGPEERIEPVFVGSGIYQINDGSMQAVNTVRDGVTAITFNTDVSDITTATPGAGQYDTSLSTGYIKLGSTPDDVVTVSAEGHDGSSLGYVDTISGILKLIATEFAGFDENTELDTVAFTQLAAHTAVIGKYFRDPITILEAMSFFHTSAASWGWLRPEKLLTVGRITDPDLSTPDFYLTFDDLRDGTWVVEPWEIPVWRVLVLYRPNSKVIDTGISLTTVETVKEDISREGKMVEAKDASVLQQIPDARTITIKTNLYDSSDAQDLADEQLDLRKKIRYRGLFSPRTRLDRGIGQVFELSDDRLHSNPKKWVITGGRIGAERTGGSDEIVWECYG